MSDTCEFGPFRLETDERRLLRDGRPLPLPPKAFDLLVALVSRAGRLVTKEALLKEVWPDSFVEEGNLSYTVSLLRKALGDEGEPHRWIETVPRRGYRFIGAITAPVTPPSDRVDAPPHPDRERLRRWAPIAAGLVAVIAIPAVLFRGASAPESAPAPFDPLPLTGYPGAEIHPSFSPEGTQVAFAWNGESQEQFEIFVTLAGAGHPLQLTLDPGDDISPAWSPDGRWIAFLRRPPAAHAVGLGSTGDRRIADVFLVPALGGPERRLAEVRLAGLDPGPYLCWARDGSALIVPDRFREDAPFGLVAIDVQSGAKRHLTVSPLLDTTPALSSDGRTLAFTRLEGLGISEIYVLPLTAHLEPAGDPTPVTSRRQVSRSPIWTADGDDLLYTSGPLAWAGPRALWRQSRSDPDSARAIPLPHQTVADPVLAPGRGTLAYVSSTRDWNVWRLPLETPSRVSGPPARLIFSSYGEKQPQVSPDGRRVAFGSTRSGREEIWVCDADGTNPVKLTSFGGPSVGSPRWSPDGRHIVFDAFPDGSGEIFVIAADGGAPRRLTDDPHQDLNPSWSRDGAWIYFISNRGGASDVWKIPAPGGSRPRPPVQLTRSGDTFGPMESFDGADVFYLRSTRVGTGSPDVTRTRLDLWRVPRDGGTEVKVIEDVAGGSGYAIGRDGIYFLRAAPSGTDVDLVYRPTGGTDIVLTTFPRTRHVNHLAVSPDGRSVLYTQDDAQSADLMLVNEFR